MPRTKKVKPEETKKEVKNTSEVKPSVAEATEISAEKKEKKVAKPDKGYFVGSGRRKTATAKVRLYLPTKDITINGKKLERGDTYVNNRPIEQYFPDPFSKATYSEIYRTTNTAGRFITTVITTGSGRSGQLGAVVLAISRALVTVDPRFRPILRKRGFLTRDPRAKERKKPGLMGARKEKQSPKR